MVAALGFEPFFVQGWSINGFSLLRSRLRSRKWLTSRAGFSGSSSAKEYNCGLLLQAETAIFTHTSCPTYLSGERAPRPGEQERNQLRESIFPGLESFTKRYENSTIRQL